MPAAAQAPPTPHAPAPQGQDGDAAAFFEDLFQVGTAAPGDSGAAMDSRPPWVDDEGILLGQRFAEKYFFALIMAEMSSALIFMSVGDSLRTLIFTGNSDTPAKAFRRYLSTFTRVVEWYRNDLWEEKSKARRDIQIVRQMHVHYRRQIADASREERLRKTTLQPPLLQGDAAEAMRQALRDVRTSAVDVNRRQEWINQMEMSMTQISFVGLIVTYPERFGAAEASEEELEGFVHLWRVLGHLLGVEERFNFCVGGLEAVRRRTHFAVHRIVIPALAQADASWEHMSRCVVEGVGFILPGITYEVLLVYALEAVGVAVPSLRASLGVAEALQLRILAILLRWVLRVPTLRTPLTWCVNRLIAEAQKISPEQLRAQEERVYSRQRAAAVPAPSSPSKFLPFALPLLALAALGGCALYFLPWAFIGVTASVLIVGVYVLCRRRDSKHSFA